jgi:hypothetical protein
MRRYFSYYARYPSRVPRSKPSANDHGWSKFVRLQNKFGDAFIHYTTRMDGGSFSI